MVRALWPQGSIVSIGLPQLGIRSIQDFLGSFIISVNLYLPHGQWVTICGVSRQGLHYGWQMSKHTCLPQSNIFLHGFSQEYSLIAQLTSFKDDLQ